MSEHTEIEKLSGANIYKLPITVVHAELERVSDDSIFKSVCPACNEGWLLAQRDQQTLKLIAEDICILCGQHYVYSDIDDLKKKADEAAESKE